MVNLSLKVQDPKKNFPEEKRALGLTSSQILGLGLGEKDS